MRIVSPLFMDNHSDAGHDWQWKGTWNEFTGKVKQTWGDMTDDDMKVAEGNFQEMLGRVQRRTGESIEKIREKLS